MKGESRRARRRRKLEAKLVAKEMFRRVVMDQINASLQRGLSPTGRFIGRPAIGPVVISVPISADYIELEVRTHALAEWEK